MWMKMMLYSRIKRYGVVLTMGFHSFHTLGQNEINLKTIFFQAKFKAYELNWA